MESRENLARNLRALRTSSGLSQEALAELAGVDRTYVSGVECRRYSVGLDRLDRLAKALSTSGSALISE